MTQPPPTHSEWIHELSPSTQELAYELIERQQQRHSLLEEIPQFRLCLAEPQGKVRVETSYLLQPVRVILPDHPTFAHYLTHALRCTAHQVRTVLAELVTLPTDSLSAVSEFMPTVSSENDLRDPGDLPTGMVSAESNREFLDDFRQHCHSRTPTSHSAVRATLTQTFTTPVGEIGVTVDKTGLPIHLFSPLPAEQSVHIVWMAHEGARRMRDFIRDRTQELRHRTFELSDLISDAPRYEDLQVKPDLAGPAFADDYEQERYHNFVWTLRAVKETG